MGTAEVRSGAFPAPAVLLDATLASVTLAEGTLLAVGYVTVWLVCAAAALVSLLIVATATRSSPAPEPEPELRPG
jgi:hypothetical protein